MKTKNVFKKPQKMFILGEKPQKKSKNLTNLNEDLFI